MSNLQHVDDKAFTYRFEPVRSCPMCTSRDSRVLGRRLNGHQGLRPAKTAGITTTVVACRSCGLIYSNPRPVPESLADHYGTPPEKYWRDAQLAANDASHGIPVDVFNRLWYRRGRPQFLDIGAGLGQTMVSLSRHGFDSYGFEPSAPFRDRAIERGLDPERLKLASIEDAEYEPGSFDLVSFGAVLEHVHDPAAALERAFKWVRQGGLLFAEIPSARWLIGRLLNVSYRARRLDYVTNLSPMHPPYHLYEFTVESFAAHGRRAGYEVASYQVLPCETFLPGAVDPIARRIMAATGTGMQLQIWLRPPPTSAPRRRTRLSRRAPAATPEA
jgi:SAM-dependent methyltransferase